MNNKVGAGRGMGMRRMGKWKWHGISGTGKREWESGNEMSKWEQVGTGWESGSWME